MTPETAPNPASVPPFDRVLCALDGSDEALDGAFQGWRLSPGRPLTLVHVVELLDAPAVRDARPGWVHDQRQDAAALLTDARERLVALGVTSPIDVTIRGGRHGEHNPLCHGGRRSEAFDHGLGGGGRAGAAPTPSASDGRSIDPAGP